MKRLLSIAICAFLSLSGVCACAEPLPEATAAPAFPEEANTLTDIQLPDEFAISYERVAADQHIETISLIRDANGDLYYRDDSNEYLFIQARSGYQVWRRGLGGRFVQDAGNPVYAESYVRSQTQPFWDCADPWFLKHCVRMQTCGEAEILNRACSVYSIGQDILGFRWECEFMFDRETGLCLASTADTSLGGYALDGESGAFQCVRFDTENIRLPER